MIVQPKTIMEVETYQPMCSLDEFRRALRINGVLWVKKYQQEKQQEIENMKSGLIDAEIFEKRIFGLNKKIESTLEIHGLTIEDCK